MTSRLSRLRHHLAEALTMARPELRPHILTLLRRVAGQLARRAQRRLDA